MEGLNMAEKTAVNAWINKDLYADCKIEAIRRDITLAEFVTNALKFYMKESGKVVQTEIEIT